VNYKHASIPITRSMCSEEGKEAESKAQEHGTITMSRVVPRISTLQSPTTQVGSH